MYEANVVATQMFELYENILLYKSKLLNKNFKVNALGSGEISERQFLILLISGCYGVNTITQIARVLRQTTGSISIIISKLVKNGYMKKEYPKAPDDKRKVFFSLTSKGSGTLREMMRHFLKEIMSFYNERSPAQRECFTKGYSKLADLIPDMDSPQTQFLLSALREESEEENLFPFEILNKIIYFLGWIGKNYSNEFSINKECKLTHNKFRILGLIVHERISTIQELSAVTNISESALSITLSKLTEDGYIYRKRPDDDDDGRKIYFFPTENGEEVFLNMKRNLYMVFEGLFNNMPEKSKAALYEGIELLKHAFDMNQYENA